MLVVAACAPSPAHFRTNSFLLRGAAIEHSRLGALEGMAALASEDAELLAGERLIVTLADTIDGRATRQRFVRLSTSSAGVSGVRAHAVETGRPAEFALQPNEPNPFGNGTLIRFAVPQKSAVTIEVFDVHGRRVKTLVRGEWHAGFHATSWDGRDDRGRRLGAGVYLCRMSARDFQATRKLAVLP